MRVPAPHLYEAAVEVVLPRRGDPEPVDDAQTADGPSLHHRTHRGAALLVPHIMSQSYMVITLLSLPAVFWSYNVTYRRQS